jgi:hypothetical protein
MRPCLETGLLDDAPQLCPEVSVCLLGPDDAIQSSRVGFLEYVYEARLKLKGNRDQSGIVALVVLRLGAANQELALPLIHVLPRWRRYVGRTTLH